MPNLNMAGSMRVERRSAAARPAGEPPGALPEPPGTLPEPPRRDAWDRSRCEEGCKEGRGRQEGRGPHAARVALYPRCGTPGKLPFL